jgi:beta-glucosidase
VQVKSRLKFRLLVMAVLLAVVVSPIQKAAAAETNAEQPWLEASRSSEERTELLLQAMNLEEKISLVTGNVNDFYGFYNAPLERLGIPALTMADGPAGVRIAHPDIQDKKSTALPAPIALAASWDPNAAKVYGELIGNEAINTTHNVVLGPGFDIARLPWGGRNFESLGEDPLLQSIMGVAYTNGVQSEPVIAVAKHYLMNNQETERFTTNAKVSERAIQEIYSRPFAAAVQQANLGGVMCSFNKINGVYACENKTVLTDILKDQFGFTGMVMSDYGANMSTVESAVAGLDLETPGEPYGVWGSKLLTAVNDGLVSEKLINDKVRRIVTPMFTRGLFDTPARNTAIAVAEHGATARKLAEESMVLLQNKDAALPLNSNKLKSIAVIGPEADNASSAGGGSSLVNPTYTVSPLEGIRKRAGSGTAVEYAAGTDPITPGDLYNGPSAVPSSVLSPAQSSDSGVTGLKGEFWKNTNFEGEPALVRTEPQVNLNLGFYNFGGFNAQSSKASAIPGDLNGKISARWTGEITAPKTGEYELSLTSLGSSKLYLDDKLLIDNKGTQLGTTTAKVQLTSGDKHSVRIEYRADSASHENSLVGAQIRFGWNPPTGTVESKMQEAVELAKKSEVAVVFTRTYDGEGFVDRSDLDLPNNQERLIREVAAVNPNTIVVNMSGRAVQMDQWKDEVKSIVQAWYAGQEQGNAVARVLFGDVNPSGKLPVTFPVDEDSTPVSDESQFPGINGEGEYSEGIFVGYRGYNKLGIAPAFPFGHGLSYTSFEYRNLKAKASGSTVQVSLNLRNTGKLTGSEVVQVYTGKLPTSVETPAKQLAGWTKVELKAGKQQRVTIDLDPKALSYWDEKNNKWVMPSGEVPIYVGSSSGDIRLEGKVTITDKADKSGKNKK